MTHLILLILLIISVVAAISMKDLLKAAIALGLVSAVLSIIFFRFDSPYAAVFELSIASGLITVLFTSVVSLTGQGEDKK